MKRYQRGLLEGPMLYGMIGLGLLCVASWGATYYLNGKLDDARVEVVIKEGQRAAQEQSRKGFQAAGATCSESVSKLQDEAKTQKAKYEAGQAASRTRTASAEAQVATLLSKQRPAGLNECQAVKLELNAEIDRRHP